MILRLRHICRVLLRGLLAAGLPLAALAASPANAPDESAISAAIAQLGDASFEKREEASRRLWAMGAAAEPALRRAMTDPDPEIAARASAILADFRMGLHADTPPQIVEQVRAYPAATLAGRQQIIRSLVNAGPEALLPLAGLCAGETNRAQRAMLFADPARRVGEAVGAYIAAGDLDAAARLLEMGNLSGLDESHRSYTAFCLLTGRLDEELARRRADVQQDIRSGELAVLRHLYRAKGELAGARWVATSLGDESRNEAILREQEDWRALVNLAQRGLFNEPENIERLGFLATYQRLAGDGEGFEATMRQIARQAQSPGMAWYVAEVMFLNDRAQQAIDVLIGGGLLREAMHVLIAQDRYAEALALVERAERTNHPDLPRIRMRAAWLHRTLGDIEHSDRLFDDLVKATQEQADAALHMSLLQAMIRAGLDERAFGYAAGVLPRLGPTPQFVQMTEALFPGRGPEAETWCRVLMWQRPDDAPARVLARLRELMEGRTEQAALEDLFRFALGRADRLIGARQGMPAEHLTAPLVERGQGDRAVAILSQVAAENADADLWLETAILCSAQKRWQQCADSAARVIQKHPTSSIAHMLRGQAMGRLGLDEEGRCETLVGALLPLGRSPPRLALIRALERAALPEAALEQKQVLLRLAEPDSAEYGEVMRTMPGMDAAAQARWRQQSTMECLKLSTSFVEPAGYVTVPYLIHRLEARAALARKDVNTALRHIDAALSLMPASIELPIEVVGDLARLRAAEQAGRVFDSVLAANRKLVAEHPRSANLHNSLAWYLARCRRDLDTALMHARKAAELSPGNTAILDTLAEVHFQLGDREKAESLLRRCIELEPRDPRHRAALERIVHSSPDTAPPE